MKSDAEGIQDLRDIRIDARFPDLAGKTAVVTGASRGIGCGIASFLGAQGMRVVITARTEDKGIAFAGQLAAAGVACVWVTADVSTADGAAAVFDAAFRQFGAVDLLVNNAANLRSKAFLDLDPDTYVASFERNVRMVYEMSRIAAKHMAERAQGVIINISSVGGLRGHRGMCGYDASKGAIDALTRSMALDLAPHGIRVNGVAPGATRSPRHDLPPEPGRRTQYIEGIPLQRLGLPKEMGAAVAFLASNAAAYITGQTLYVDGGLIAQLTPAGIFI